MQLVLNAIWSWLFFNWRKGLLAIVDVVLLLIAILLTTFAFAKIDVVAALLMLPYLAWVAFATLLTIALVRRNPSRL